MHVVVDLIVVVDNPIDFRRRCEVCCVSHALNQEGYIRGITMGWRCVDVVVMGV